MKPTQSRRPLAIQTALGPDAFLLTRFSVRERLSAPFEIEADLAATDAQADFNKVVGHKAAIRLELGGNGTRYFQGYVSRLVQTGNRGGFARYRATLVPWLWFLTRTSDCRVFQRESALDIAEKVFGGHRFGADFYDLRTTGTIPKRRYCVQYRETDFNFINRLLESEGIYYWFDHTDKGHKLVLANAIGASKPAKGYEKLEYHEVEQAGIAGREVVTEWAVEKEVQPVQYQLKDFDFKKPSDPLKAKHEVTREHGMARFALYDYPGEYFEPEDATRYAQLRMEEVQARHELVRGVTSAMGLTAGGVFELQKHPLTSENRKYLITDLQLTADAGEFASGGGGGPFFSCHFTAVPSTVPFRPARMTPKPIIQGVQTATVVGPAGEEIHTDEHARVKVQFHWDRYGKKDADSSCFIRVSQPWAGQGWGSQATPRIGQEVLVEFIEGDPDRPIITGRVYNDEQKPPYASGKGVVSGLKSQTHKGSGYNEMSLDDTAGKEKITIHGQYDMNTTVQNDKTTTVKSGNRTMTVESGTNTETIKGNSSHTVQAGSRTVDVTGGDHSTTSNDGAVIVHGKGKGVAIEGNVKGVTVKGTGEGVNLDGNGGLGVNAYGDPTFNATGKTKASITSPEVNIGNKVIKIVGSSSIELSVGGNSIKIDTAGVTINGTKITSAATGTHEITGALVKIN